MIRQELNPETCRLEMKQRSRKLAGTSIQRPGSISQNVIAVFVGCRTMTFPAAPCTRLKTLALDLKRERTEGRKREKFYIYLDVTHTHSRAGKTLKGKRKKKADTRRADGQKQRRGGGEQTDLRNQPTRRNGPDQNSAHT